MTRLQAISRFSPGNCDPAFLESITVGREELLRALEKGVSSSVRSGAGHHCLIVGPRGSGKTHLVALLRDRVQRNEKLHKRVVIAYLKEEERGVAHFLDWLVRILQSFVRHEEAEPELAREIEHLMDMEHEAAQAAAEQLLVRFVSKRRLLLLVENLGEIFSSKKGMGREGQQRFRDLVQQHPFWTIVATTQALFDDVQTRDAPFYGFFKIQHVQSLTFEEAASLLERLAEVEQRPKLHAFLKTAPARGRIRAVHMLTRGSPRLLVIFYQFIDSDSVEDLSRSFLDMVDSLTSYYQERMNALSSGQQKIVEALCSQRAPMTVKQIARSCFISPSTASSELKRLADMRYVTFHRAGRESYYEISEPLFRICFEVKENRGYPVRLFMDFLGTFYTVEELERKRFESDDNATDTEMAVAGSMLPMEYPLEVLPRFLAGYRATLMSSGHTRPFMLRLTHALTNLLRSRDKIGLDRLQSFATGFIPELAHHEELAAMSRLLAVAVRYLSEKDDRILLGLPQEERQVVVEMLAPPAEPEPRASS